MNYKESLRRGNLSANCAGNLAQPDVASILVKVPADGGVDELLPAAPGVVAPWSEWPGRCLFLNLLCQGTGNQHTDECEKFDMGQYIHKCCQQILQRGYSSLFSSAPPPAVPAAAAPAAEAQAQCVKEEPARVNATTASSNGVIPRRCSPAPPA